AYQFSEGHLFGGNSPESITRSIAQFQNLPHHPEKKVGFSDIHQLLHLPLKNNITSDYFSNTLSPLAYVPQVLGITLGRILNLSPLLLMYLGRIFNLISWTFLIFTAIKTTPIYKWLFC